MGTLYEDWHQELFLVADVVVVGPSIDRKYICRHQYDGRTTTSGLPVILTRSPVASFVCPHGQVHRSSQIVPRLPGTILKD